MAATILRVTLTIMLLVAGASAFAQFDNPYDSFDPFGQDEGSAWGLSIHQTNVWENGQFFDTIDNYYFDDDDEPIDEIIVRAKRRAANRLFLGELYANMDWAIFNTLNYNQQTECQMIENVDPGTACCTEPESNPACMTTNYTVAALGQSQVNELNIAYSMLQNIESGSLSLTVGGLSAIFTGGMSTTAGMLTSLVATTGTWVASLPDRNSINPFAVGDSFTLTMTMCASTDGFSQPSTTINVSYTGG